jgi:FtsH-binding integral membrane protein
VLQALVFTLGIFVFLSLFACQTKYDFTSWMPYLFGALWVLILFGFMTMLFPQTKGVELGYGIAAALIFSAYILVDTQLIMRHYHVEVRQKDSLCYDKITDVYCRRKLPRRSACTSTSSTCSSLS